MKIEISKEQAQMLLNDFELEHSEDEINLSDSSIEFIEQFSCWNPKEMRWELQKDIDWNIEE